MIKVKRFEANPILSPNPKNEWEKQAVFNGCPINHDKLIYMLYRAMSSELSIDGKRLELSTIGRAVSSDRTDFRDRVQFMSPEKDWEKFGLEDPRVTCFEGKYYIFYTALSEYPFVPESIKIGLAITQDFYHIEEKHLVTPFNSKAMALFPERINGKLTAILTANTDKPPSTIGLAFFDEPNDLWNQDKWQDWYASLEDHAVHLLKSSGDHLEIGAPPLKTEKGWLLVYCYIYNYLSDQRVFAIEAALLDLKDPFRVVGATNEPLLVPERDYELYGKVPNVIFPSGAMIFGGELGIYYGGADTSVCLATISLEKLFDDIKPKKKLYSKFGEYKNISSVFSDNPIISPIPEHKWESRFTFNPAAVYESGKVHIVYRAMGEDYTSVLGYASSRDGFQIDERLDHPIYKPRVAFEKKFRSGVHSGCEDPRITRIGDKYYMCYTAYDGKNPTRVALTSISVENFLDHVWSFDKPVMISPPHVDDKNACILEEKAKGKYVVFHRLYSSIWIDYVDSLDFDGKSFVKGKVLMRPRAGKWDSEKIGIGPPPIKTDEGWLLIYHGLNHEDRHYRLGAALLDREDPLRIISRLDYPILEPEEECTYLGLRSGTVFACGAVSFDNQIFIYYGGADQFVCAATIDKTRLLNLLKKNISVTSY